MIHAIMDATRRNIFIVFGIAAGFAALVMFVFLGLVVWQRYINPPLPPVPPIRYSTSVFLPERAVYAPGETLRYTPTLTLRAETEIEGIRTIVSAHTRRTARLCDGTSALPIPIHSGAEEGTEANIDGGAFVAVPIPKLPPGEYWVRTFVHGFGESSGQATYRVLFSVKEPC